MAGVCLAADAPAPARDASVSVPDVAAASAAATPATRDAALPARARADTLYLNNRSIAVFRVPLLGRSPAERASVAQATLEALLERDGPGRVTLWQGGTTVGVQLDGSIVFHLTADDLGIVASPLGAPEPALDVRVAQAAEAVRLRLEQAVAEAREANDLRRIAEGAAWSVAATGIAALLVRLVFLLRRAVTVRVATALARWKQTHGDQSVVGTYWRHARVAASSLVTLTAWALVLVTAEIWATFVLRQFAYTRPWGERSRAWLLELLQRFAIDAAAAVPGLLTAAIIVVLARLVHRLFNGLMRRVERGEITAGALDPDTAPPTRRIGNFVIWLFALAMAYPFLPGANSEAFKGVSVLAGLMLSLGASSIVGQIVSGLGLMYSRALRPGEYVKVGETEGTVTQVGMFATKVQTGMGEEVSLPNAVVFSQPVRNFSRLVEGGKFVLHGAVTIGYATPWRQVHAMLLEAAARTPGVATEPPPYVIQNALSDFYVEYRLCAQSNHAAPRRRADAMSQLNANIQDVFNENGVQIMSPHYMSDPPQPQVVPPDASGADGRELLAQRRAGSG